MTTVETTREMAPPEPLIEPDPLLSEIERGPLYEALVAELGDPKQLVAEIGEREQTLVDAIAEYGAWCGDVCTDFRVWVKTWDDQNQYGGQHRLEEMTDDQ